MKIQLYNSLSKKVEAFAPQKEAVSIYSCGPTVYNRAHIGNMRSFLFADLLQRVLKVVGKYKVNWVMNITDIDDKTIRDSKPEANKWLDAMGEPSDDIKLNLKSFTKYYTQVFLDDLTALGIDTEDFYALPKATDYINQMQDLTQLIYDNGFAYVAEGSVYFDVNKWKDADKYGKLFKIDFDNFRKGERVDSDEYEKENVSDFVLWKAKKDDEPYWEFELAGDNLPGRPGWHLECSTMSKELFKELPFDIHTGGIDLKFPHHEDEIAQSKSGYGEEPARFWCHNEFLEVEGEKMSKSLGNFYTIKDLTDKGLNPIDIRFAMMTSHYGSKYNFTFAGIEAAKKARLRIQDYIYKLFEVTGGKDSIDVDKVRDNIYKELANDLHTPKALGAVFTFINNNDPENFNNETKDKLQNLFFELNSIFSAWKISAEEKENLEIPAAINELALERWEAKKNKNWAECDRIRDVIQDKGFKVIDKKDGFELEKLND